MGAVEIGTVLSKEIKSAVRQNFQTSFSKVSESGLEEVLESMRRRPLIYPPVRHKASLKQTLGDGTQHAVPLVW